MAQSYEHIRDVHHDLMQDRMMEALATLAPADFMDKDTSNDQWQEAKTNAARILLHAAQEGREDKLAESIAHARIEPAAAQIITEAYKHLLVMSRATDSNMPVPVAAKEGFARSLRELDQHLPENDTTTSVVLDLRMAEVYATSTRSLSKEAVLNKLARSR